MHAVSILNGPNLNLLGCPSMQRYGSETLAGLERRCHKISRSLAFELSFRQTNHEGVLVDWIQDAIGTGAGIVINAGVLSFTSLTIAESLAMSEQPVIEVHLSNTHTRPEYGASLLSPNVTAVLCGVGPAGYELALKALHALMPSKTAGASRA